MASTGLLDLRGHMCRPPAITIRRDRVWRRHDAVSVVTAPDVDVRGLGLQRAAISHRENESRTEGNGAVAPATFGTAAPA